MDTEAIRRSTEVLTYGISREWLIALVCLSGAFIIVLTWWLQRPMTKLQETLDKVLDRVKTDKELEDMIENNVLKHTVACEGKALMPRVLNALDKNTQVIQEHSHSSRSLTEAAHNLTEATHSLTETLKARS